MFDERNRCAAFADLFASVTFTAQYGNFQRLFLDLTRASARFDITSGSLFLCGASRLAQDFFFSRRPDVETFCDICPDVTVSLQQQVIHFFRFIVLWYLLEILTTDWGIVFFPMGTLVATAYISIYCTWKLWKKTEVLGTNHDGSGKFQQQQQQHSLSVPSKLGSA